MHDGATRFGLPRSGLRTVALTITLLAGFSYGVRAEDEIEKAHAEAGRQWYDKYCTPCHGPGGAPGTAVYRDTKQPVDLREYMRRHGGKFPAGDWIAVVATDNPALLHASVWDTIRQSQAGSAAPDSVARGLVASIAVYIRSVQKK